mgnify:CR=1 FL=1
MAVAACSIYKVKMMRDEMRAPKFSILNLIENKDDSWEKFLVFMLQYFLFVLTSKSWAINTVFIGADLWQDDKIIINSPTWSCATLVVKPSITVASLLPFLLMAYTTSLKSRPGLRPVMRNTGWTLLTLASMISETTSITSSMKTWSRPPSKPASHLRIEKTQINHTKSQAAVRGMPFLDLCDKVAV